MPTKEPLLGESIPVFDTYLNFVRAYARSYWKDYQREPSDASLMACLDFGRIVEAVIIPLSAKSQQEDYQRAYRTIADAMFNLGRDSAERAGATFPDDSGLQLIHDRLDDIEVQIRQCLSRRYRRACRVLRIRAERGAA